MLGMKEVFLELPSLRMMETARLLAMSFCTILKPKRKTGANLWVIDFIDMS
jgi:hypothetical protein